MLTVIYMEALLLGRNDDGDGGDLAAPPSRIPILTYNQYKTVLRRGAVIKVEYDVVAGTFGSMGGCDIYQEHRR